MLNAGENSAGGNPCQGLLQPSMCSVAMQSHDERPLMLQSTPQRLVLAAAFRGFFPQLGSTSTQLDLRLLELGTHTSLLKARASAGDTATVLGLVLLA